jgi:hypothetical protein
MQKVGITDLPPLKEISSLRFIRVGKEFWVIYSEIFFMLPGSFVFSVVTPFYFAHLDNLTVSHLLYGIQNSDWPLAV